MQVWAGVGWTYLAYKVMDAHSKVWEYFFTLIFLLGAWFLINLVIAVLGASYEQQQERLHLACISPSSPLISAHLRSSRRRTAAAGRRRRT